MLDDGDHDDDTDDRKKREITNKFTGENEIINGGTH